MRLLFKIFLFTVFVIIGSSCQIWKKSSKIGDDIGVHRDICAENLLVADKNIEDEFTIFNDHVKKIAAEQQAGNEYYSGVDANKEHEIWKKKEELKVRFANLQVRVNDFLNTYDLNSTLCKTKSGETYNGKDRIAQIKRALDDLSVEVRR